MNAQFSKHGSEGFTLVELLVTILIIVILSVTMLPLLKPFVTQAQYSAEGVPVIGNIRTKVELFRIENDYLPGVPTADGKVVEDSTSKYATSDLGTSKSAVANGYNVVQTMEVDKTTATTPTEKFMCAGTQLTLDNDIADHVWSRAAINYSDLTGKKLRPEDFQYAVIKSKGDSYYWVIACFGQGQGGLAAGCGYAVVEFNDPDNKRKFVGTFENYKPVSSDALSLDITATAPGKKQDMLATKKVWLPAATLLFDASTQTDYETQVGAMRTAGWDVH